MSESEEAGAARKTRYRGPVLAIGLAFIVGFIVFGIIAIQVWEYSNSVAFCSNVCHDVHPEETEAFQDSLHARVKCTECHMGRTGTLQGILLKATHFRHLPAVLFDNYERPLRSETMRPANESCELCHWPASFHYDSVLDVDRYALDEENTAESVYLILKTGGGTRERGLGAGIHWHILNEVEYIALDEEKQEIRWVRSRLPDGRVVEFNDISNPLSPEVLATAEVYTMDCVDCHNRAGHPFSGPEGLVDDVLAAGLVSRELPYVKKEMLGVLATLTDMSLEPAEVAAVFEERYVDAYPSAARAEAAALDDAVAVVKDLASRLVFEEEEVTWQSFPDNGEHKDFAGCFRCHDGKHLSADGESIRLHCNICHGIPVTTEAGTRVPPLPPVTVSEPDSHLETNFMADHRFQASDACAECHGEIAFGTDDSSFCANSACHGRAWPAVELDAGFEHPLVLEGRHAAVWCHDCHEGVEKPEYVCANCHEAPTVPHFGDDCETCHSPLGFETAFLAEFEHPIVLEGIHATLECLDCHTPGVVIKWDCASCHEPPSERHFGPDCASCHEQESFKGATIEPEQHPIPLVGAHLRATCAVCHADGQRVPEYVCSNCHRPPENHLEGACDQCHTPEGWKESVSRMVAAIPIIPHTLEGRDDCLLCHDPTGQIMPAPSTHVGRINEQCTLCHKPAS